MHIEQNAKYKLCFHWRVIVLVANSWIAMNFFRYHIISIATEFSSNAAFQGQLNSSSSGKTAEEFQEK